MPPTCSTGSSILFCVLSTLLLIFLSSLHSSTGLCGFIYWSHMWRIPKTKVHGSTVLLWKAAQLSGRFVTNVFRLKLCYVSFTSRNSGVPSTRCDLHEHKQRKEEAEWRLKLHKHLCDRLWFKLLDVVEILPCLLLCGSDVIFINSYACWSALSMKNSPSWNDVIIMKTSVSQSKVWYYRIMEVNKVGWSSSDASERLMLMSWNFDSTAGVVRLFCTLHQTAINGGQTTHMEHFFVLKIVFPHRAPLWPY